MAGFPNGHDGVKHNGIVVTGYRILQMAMVALMTLLVGLSLAGVNRVADSLDKMSDDLSSLRGEVFSVRETMAANYITRQEVEALARAVEHRLNQRIDRELERPRTSFPPARDRSPP